MNNAPILILQMQRMGDIVLSFPLLHWLQIQFPSHPVWVIAEPVFFEPLMPLSPAVTYFPYSAIQKIADVHFHAVINLSHRPEATALAGRLKTDLLIGSYLSKNEQSLYVQGNWQLYRSSITHNNYFNLYHWSDLNALDVINQKIRLKGSWPKPRSIIQNNSRSFRVGLFLGASQKEKHPEASFWAEVVKILLREGIQVALLGGKEEVAMGQAVQDRVSVPLINLCGKFSIKNLIEFMESLDLLVTPDTGPMHVATWVETPVLNLSVGPVNPWETGPFSPGNHVLSHCLSCQGCWECAYKKTFCKQKFIPKKVSLLVKSILSGENPENLKTKLSGNVLFRTNREDNNLYVLETVFFEAQVDKKKDSLSPTSSSEKESVNRKNLSKFWQAWFGYKFGLFQKNFFKEILDAQLSLEQKELFISSMATMLASFSNDLKHDPLKLLGNNSLWTNGFEWLKPVTMYGQMYMQNENASRKSMLHVLSLLEELSSFFRL